MIARTLAPRSVCPACGRHTVLRQDSTPRAHWNVAPETGLWYIGNRRAGVGRRTAQV